MLITVLYRAAGAPDMTGESVPFVDVPRWQFYYDAVLWAYQQSIVTGADATHFAPDRNLTREEMTTILYRWWTKEQPNAAKEEPVQENEAEFSDWNLVAEYARKGMSWAVTHGIVLGTGSGRLEPRSFATRAQVAAMLQRYWENSDWKEAKCQ